MLLCIGENLGLSSNGGNTDNGSNTGNGGNAGNGDNYGGVTGALPEGGNAVQAGDSKVLSGSVTGVTGVTTSGKPVYNPSDGESRQGNLEPFFPGGLKTGISLPRGGPSIEDLASRAGVSVEAVQEELDRWKKCGRLKEGDDGTIHLLAGTSYPGQDEPEPKEEDEPPVSAPKGPPKLPAAPPERRHIGMKDVTLSDAEEWASVVPGLVQRLKAQAVREHDPVMERSARDLYESLVRIEYADHLQKESDGEASGEDHIPDAGKKVPPGQEGGVPGQESGQGSLFFPPDEPPAPATPPKENPFLKEEGHSSPRGADRSGPPPGWLDAQPEDVRAEYRAKVKRLKGVSMPDYEAVALLRTWEEFRGRR